MVYSCLKASTGGSNAAFLAGYSPAAIPAIASDPIAANADAERLSSEALGLVQRQYQLGAVSYLASLDAQRTALSTRVALVQARAARFTDTAALFRALGGGWWNAPDAVASAAGASSAARARVS